MRLRGIGLGDGQEGMAGQRDNGEETIIVFWGGLKDCNKTQFRKYKGA